MYSRQPAEILYKERYFDAVAVQVTSHELSQALVGLRLANIYDISSKKLLLKFAVSGKKEQLIIDTGFRTHLTDFTRTTAAAPSAFTSRLRKFLKTRRCTSVAQIGTDRIIELQFGDGFYRLYLEFFAAGNVILTDADLTIQAILRNVSEGDGQEPQRVGLKYTLENRQNFAGVPPLTRDRVRQALETTIKRTEAAESSSKKKHKRKPGDELRRGLATTLEELPPIVVDHAFEVTGFEPTAKPAEVLENETLFDSVFVALEEARKIVDEVTGSATCKGYIFAKRIEKKGVEPAKTEDGKTHGLLYEDFQPFLPKRYANDAEFTVLTFDNFNKTVDEFFSSLEGQKLESRLNDREAAAKRKLEAVKEIQEQRVEGLKQVQMLNLRKAGAIEANVDRVQEAMDAVNGLISQGMDWYNIGKLVEREQKRRNPVAEIIKLPLKIEQDVITLLLAEEDEEQEEESDDDKSEASSDDDEEEAKRAKTAADKRLVIDINLGLTPYANAREYYDQKKVASIKEQKTVEQTVGALKSAEKKIAEDLKKGLKQEKPTMQLVRHQMWFEKFLWFISSDGYLVVGGRDASQNEMLYKKHLRKGDVYVHADMHGAASVVIKNNPKTPDAPIPPSTLAQAGSLTVCSSNAWDSKAGMGAWWVNAEQVSKSAPTGDYLPAGSFMVRGSKNILTPQPLVLGFGFLFKISEESKANHVKHRLHENDEPRSEQPNPDFARDETLLGDTLANSEEDSATFHHEQEVQSTEQPTGNAEDDQDEGEDGARRNPLQTSGGHESGDESDMDEQLLKGDIDHVTDNVSKLDVEDSGEAALMSGALADHTEAAEDVENKSPDPNEVEADDDQSETATEAPTEAPSVAGTTTSQQPGQKTAPAKRGQRSKQKKIAAKYKNQDEEDRAMYEQLIGAAKGREKAEAEAKAKAERQAELQAREERRQQAQLKHKKKMAEHEEIRQMMLAEGVEVLNDDEEQAATPLDVLIGTPFVGDEILEAIPCCAPWAAMAKCKYKVKLQPGSTKKGKAIKEILERLKIDAGKKGNVDEQSRDTERMWPREIELIKMIKPEEAHNVVPVGKMTVMQGGGSGGGKGGGGGGGGKGKGGKGGKGGKKK